ncbi:MAG: hypothetical protein ACO1OF_12755 [Adhaeribacter sp.]
MSWQIVPANLSQWLQQTDAGKAQRVMTALMQMDKLNLEQLQQAAAPEHLVTA